MDSRLRRNDIKKGGNEGLASGHSKEGHWNE